MAWGFLAHNDAGGVQLSENTVAMSFRSKTTIAALSATDFGNAYVGGPLTSSAVFWVVDYTGQMPCVAARVDGGRELYVSHQFSAENTLLPPPAGWKRIVFWSSGTSGANLTWYLFDKLAVSTPITGYGFAIWNAAGEPIYYSAIPVYKARNVITLSAGAVGGNHSKPSAQTYAYTFANLTRGKYYPASGSARHMQSIGVRETASNNVQVTSAQNVDGYTTAPAGGVSDFWPSPLLMVDVTGL